MATQELPKTSLWIGAVTSCPTGIAHTHNGASEVLENYAIENNMKIKSARD